MIDALYDHSIRLTCHVFPAEYIQSDIIRDLYIVNCVLTPVFDAHAL